jgi:hypothetical protein
MNVKTFPITYYDDFGALRLRKDKAKTNPNAGLWPENRSTKPEILNKDI